MTSMPVHHPSGKPCPFCSVQTSRVLQKNDLAYAMFDGFPVNPGHVLVIPFRHVASFFQLSSREVTAIHELLQALKARIELEHHPDGYNVGDLLTKNALKALNVLIRLWQFATRVAKHILSRYLWILLAQVDREGGRVFTPRHTDDVLDLGLLGDCRKRFT